MAPPRPQSWYDQSPLDNWTDYYICEGLGCEKKELDLLKEIVLTFIAGKYLHDVFHDISVVRERAVAALKPLKGQCAEAFPDIPKWWLNNILLIMVRQALLNQSGQGANIKQ